MHSNNAKLHIEQQLTRYQNKSKFITWNNNRKTDLSSQISSLRMLISKLVYERQKKNNKISELIKNISRKEEEIKCLR